MKRNPSIELFRCLCMFGVCLVHALVQGGYADPHRGLDNLMATSVVGFLFISGWFGIKLRQRHIANLLGIGLYCAIIVAVLYDGWFLGLGLGASGRIWVYFKNAWFLWCYLALMFVAPAFAPLFEAKTMADRMKTLYSLLPLFFPVFGWSYAATKIPILKEYAPKVGGFGAFGLLTFIGIYCAARLCRLFELDRLLSVRTLLAIALVSGLTCWIGFMHYHSPFAFVFAGSVFLLFAKIPLREGILSRTILHLSPSMFSVYLLHNNSMGMAWLQHFEDEMIAGRGLNYYLVCLSAACVFFFGALALDFPRRVFRILLRKKRLVRIGSNLKKS